MNAHEPATTPVSGGVDPGCVPTSAPVALTKLTGRDTEVSLLKDRWEQAQEGMGQVVLLVGEAGLGKSRLVQTIKQLVAQQVNAVTPANGSEAVSGGEDASVIEWRCATRFQSTGLFPVSDHLGRILSFRSDESTAVRFDRLAQHLDDLGLG